MGCGVLESFAGISVLPFPQFSLFCCSDATCSTAGRYTNQLFILEGENRNDSFSNLSFLRLDHFCCQMIHFTFYLLSLFYGPCLFFFFPICWRRRQNSFCLRPGRESRSGLWHLLISVSLLWAICVTCFPREIHKQATQANKEHFSYYSFNPDSIRGLTCWFTYC